MGNILCDFRLLLLLAAASFIYLQMRLLISQSEYADRLAVAVESEDQCTAQTRMLIDQISIHQGRIVALEEGKRLKDEECSQLRVLVHDLERKSMQRLAKTVEPLAAVVIMACNRADYLERTIASVLKYHGTVASKFPLFVSQDGSDPKVKNTALQHDTLTYMQHVDNEPVLTERPGELIAYYKIARHYKWALDRLFFSFNFTRVVVLEDDMEIAPDFFNYFEAAADYLDRDSSIMAVSSWNDNGQKQFVQDSYALYRTDFFPGLGWMLNRSIWRELSVKWPKAYWDDWLRLKDNRKARQFICPEICRTYNFGEHGSSMGQFFQQYLKPIRLNDVQVDWKSMDLSYLMEHTYGAHFWSMVRNAKEVKGMDAVLQAYNIEGDVRVHYKDQREFERIAHQFGIFEEWKDGIPRTAYKGVVVFRFQTTRRVFLVPSHSLNTTTV